MIKETTKKIDFISFDGTRGRKATDPNEEAPTVTVNVKHARMVFGKRAIAEMGMNGKFIRLYIDSAKNIVGWKIRDKVSQEEMKVWKLCRPYSHGVWPISITKLLKELNPLKKESYTLEVRKYRDVGTLGTGDVFYYVQVKDEVEVKVTLSNTPATNEN